MKKCLIILALSLLLCSCVNNKVRYDRVNYKEADKSYWEAVYFYLPNEKTIDENKLCDIDYLSTLATDKNWNGENFTVAYDIISLKMVEDDEDKMRFLATVDITKMDFMYTAFRDKVAWYELISYRDIWQIYVVKSNLFVYEKWYGYRTDPDIKRNYCIIDY